MIDLDKEFQALDQMVEPDLVPAIERRLADPRAPRPEIDRKRGPSRLVAAVVAFVVFGAAAFFAYRAFAPMTSRVPANPSSSCRFAMTKLPIPKKGAARLIAGTSMEDLWVVGSKRPWIDRYLVHYDGATWTEVDLPANLVTAYSADIAVPAANDVWLLGDRGVSRFDGARWTEATFPGVGSIGRGEAEPTDLEVVSSDDAWATLNFYDEDTGEWAPAILHWDGERWSRSDRPTSDVTAPTRLVAVSAWGPSDVWVAGTASQGTHDRPVAMHWDGSSWTSRPVVGVRSAAIDSFGLEAIGPDDALMTVRKRVVRWDGDAWADTGFRAPSDMDVPLTMETGGSGVWAKVWNSSIARWDGEAWRTQPLGSLYAYGMGVIGDSAVFVGQVGLGTPRHSAARVFDC